MGLTDPAARKLQVRQPGHPKPSKLVMWVRSLRPLHHETQVKPNAARQPGGRQEAVPFFRARCMPDRFLLAAFRRTEANISMAAAIASSRSLVACR